MKAILSLSLAAILAGCALPAQTYIAADRATKNAAAPKLGRYAVEHPAEATEVSDLLASWEKRVAAAETQLGGK